MSDEPKANVVGYVSEKSDYVLQYFLFMKKARRERFLLLHGGEKEADNRGMVYFYGRKENRNDSIIKL